MNSPLLSELAMMLSSALFWRTFVIAAVVAYAMFIVAYVFESRVPGRDAPVWHGQSRAYMPGDFGLALLVAVAVYQRSNGTADWSDSTWFKIVSIGVGVVTFLVSRRFLYTPRDYSPEAWRSPSKRFHDFVMFLVFTMAAVYWCLPVYFATSWHGVALSKLLGFFGLALWVVCNVYDFTHDETPNSRQHPTTYRPIWATWRTRWVAKRG